MPDIHFFYSSAFLRGLLLCVWTNDLAYVRHTSEGAQTVRDLGPIYSDLRDPFAAVELRLLSVKCRCLFIPVPSYSRILIRTASIIFNVSKFFAFHAQKFCSFVRSRTRVFSFRSPMFFHCASWPQRQIFIFPAILHMALFTSYGLNPQLNQLYAG